MPIRKKETNALVVSNTITPDHALENTATSRSGAKKSTPSS